MKKVGIPVVTVAILYIAMVLYEQHKIIADYRQIPYYSLEKLGYPIANVLELHEKADTYSEDERQEKLQELNVQFATIFNYGGVGFLEEQHIKDLYYDDYTTARIDFATLLQTYVKATTLQQREQAYKDLKARYEQYEKFLQLVKEELVKEDDSN